MATYVYETIPTAPDEAPRRFECVQSMKDRPLARDPVSGQPVRRVISGGYGLLGVGASKPEAGPPVGGGGGCQAGCACHAGPRIPAF